MTQGALLGIDLPTGWSWEPLGFMAPRITSAGRGDLQPLSVYLGAGVVRRADREDNHNVLGADLDKYLHVMPGDLVFNKLRTWQGGLGASKYEGIVSPAYYVMRTGERLDARFANYVLVSSPYLAELTRLSKFMPPSQFDMPWESLKRLPMLVPPVEEQRRIADFLDDQVGRIDEVLGLRRAQLAVLKERLFSIPSQAMLRFTDMTEIDGNSQELDEGSAWGGLARYPMTPVKRMARKMARDFCPDSEVVTAFRDGFVGPRSMRREDGFTMSDLEQGYQGVEQRDLVFHGLDGFAGAFGVAVHGGRCSPVYHVMTCPTDSAEYLALALHVACQASLLEIHVPSTRQRAVDMRNWSTFGAFRVPRPPQDLQKRLVQNVEQERMAQEGIAQALATFISSIEERKRALITAAVTGQMDVNAAKPIGVGKWVPNIGASLAADVKTYATAAANVVGS